MVTRLEKVSSDAWVLYWNRTFAFRAGQVVPLALDAVGPTRLYSLASGENEPEAGILFNLVDGGRLTPRMGNLKPGDSFWVGKPQGTFVLDQPPAVFIATGTGVAPFWSMAASGLTRGCTLVHGARRRESFYFGKQFRTIPGLTYIPCCSQPQESSLQDSDAGPGEVFPGRVTAWLRQTDCDPALRYYLCGSAEMIVEARDILVEKGVSFRNIISEVYF